jgi:adenylylsulfate kinase
MPCGFPQGKLTIRRTIGMKTNNVVWHEPSVIRDRRALLNGHKSAVVWFTGLPSSGKSTIAHAVEEKLYQQGCRTYVLDGDNVRHSLCSDLGFSAADRKENIRRIGEVARLFIDAGIIVLTAFVSPFREDRMRVRELIGSDFLEVFCDCPIEICAERDPKGHYEKARSGIIKDFTGISSPYEYPESGELVLKTDLYSADECADKVLDLLLMRSITTEGPGNR